jgi:hypothetical protein
VNEQLVLPSERRAGAVLLRGGPLGGLAVLAVALPAVVLVPVGGWSPFLALPLIVAGLVAAWRIAGLLPVRPSPPAAMWSSAAIAVAFGVWAAVTHAENMVLRRDPGAYALYAQWIGTRHGLPVDADLEAFGGAQALDVLGFSLASPAFFEVVSDGAVDVVPQFLLGGPAVFSLGWWIAGWTGMFLVGPLLGAFAVFGVAGVAARLIGPKWAPAAAGALALTFPVLHSARSTYSETPALVVVLAAAAFCVAALRETEPRRVRLLGAVGGTVLGLAGLIRIDSLVEVALLLPVAAVLGVRRHPAAIPMAGGAVTGAVVAAVPAVLLSRPYLDSISGSLRPLLAGTAVLLLGSVAVVTVARLRQGRSGVPSAPEAGTVGPADDRDPTGDPGSATGAVPWWPRVTWVPLGRWGRAGALLMALVGVILAIRPWFMTVRQDPDDPGAVYVASMQAAQNLVVDGGRTYAEQSLAWVSWWIGPVAVVAAWVTFSVLAGRALQWWRGGQRQAPSWLVVAAVGWGSSVLTLWRPGITPDHPWADRRLVVVLLPTFVIASVACVAWCLRWARRRLPASMLTVASVAAGAGLLVPLLAGVGPFVIQRTEVGEPEAAARVCAALRPGDVVLTVDARGGNEWPQVIRGVCGYPAATMSPEMMSRGNEARTMSVNAIGELVAARGGRLVLLSADSGKAGRNAITSLGQSPRPVVSITSWEDQRILDRAPWKSSRLYLRVWLASWSAPD